MNRPPLSDVDDFRRLVDLAPDAILVVDAAGAIVLAHSRAEQLFGYTRDELPAASIDRLLPPALCDLHQQHRDEYAQAPRTRPMGAGRDLLVRRKDGSEFPAEIGVSPLPTAGGPLVTAVIRDIGARWTWRPW
jgi:PAS domain S-box-containing protein